MTQTNDIIDDTINYWHEYFQLTKVHENVLDSNGGLSNQHLAIAIQILYVEKL